VETVRQARETSREGWIFSYFPFALFGLGGVVGLIGFIGWIVLMVAAHRGRYYKLPLFGDYREHEWLFTLSCWPRESCG
jgi:uncharacterized membrane protein